VIRLDPVDSCLVLTLDRPAKLNALDSDSLGELDDRLAAVERSDARALLIVGAGEKAFSVGADIEDLRGMVLAEQRACARLGQRVFQRVSDLPIVSVAMINGFAFGGGLELALACTFRLAARQARLGLPEVTLGIIPGYGGTQRLTRVVGPARAAEFIMTGRAIGAEEAERIGLINRIYDGDPISAGLKFSHSFINHSLVALRLAREAVFRSMDVSLDQGLRVEADLFTLACQTADAAEGMRAFLEKRDARFIDG
jgi:enoyl-CoA hydratase